ncbi:hypothetical protein BO225_09730 [Dubosiella newyorkensis]|uniref:N-acetyltransferase domain-containing protein n=2 Tax=Dubosiella newyorkensis TaxID=1862672 RepID=A0A1U7NKK8_9FIRM|nr:hypothetical protein BO225_09730 [Dubosiella newyorkensis]
MKNENQNKSSRSVERDQEDLYLAISEQARGHGAGSCLLEAIQEKYANQKIVLMIEQLDEKAAHFAQRIARKKFYQRNGFVSSNLLAKFPSGMMEIMQTGSSISKQEWIDLQKYALGKFFYFMSRMKVDS